MAGVLPVHKGGNVPPQQLYATLRAMSALSSWDKLVGKNTTMLLLEVTTNEQRAKE